MEAKNVLVIGQIAIDGGPPRECRMTGLAIDTGDHHPAHPIVPPGGYPHPEHPIVIPDPPTEPPLVIWGPNDPRPTPPIHWPGYPNWPPTGTPPTPPPDKWYWKYCPTIGWVLVPPGGGGKPQPVPGKA